MATYLLTWNPLRFEWSDIEEDIAAMKSDEDLVDNWSCGNTKKIQVGDRFFLMKLGRLQPRGIIGSGYVTSEPWEGTHWEDSSELSSKAALYVDVRFDCLLNPSTDILDIDALQNGIQGRMNWTPQSSGITIPDAIAEQLERLWQPFSAANSPVDMPLLPEEVPVPSTSYPEGALRRVIVNAYERNAEARQKCIEHYGKSCTVCGFSFETKYGAIGSGFIHVHHLIPVSEIGSTYNLDPINDLRPVCPNCHAMLHRHKPPYSIEELKAKLVL